MDWLKALDAEQALRNVESDFIGDWYRDPWGWPELRWLVKNQPQLLTERLEDTTTHRPILIDVPKENWMMRPAMLLEPLDRLAYQALVDSLSLKMIGDLGPWVYGWRLWCGKPVKGRYASNSKQYEFFRSGVNRLADEYAFGLTTDIVSCFASIPIAELRDEIEKQFSTKSMPVARLLRYLEDWDGIRLRSGLPQRCLASSVLAQYYMRPVDALLGSALKRQGSPPHALARWMDDIWFFAQGWEQLRNLQLDLQDCLSQIKLNLNAGKTHLYEGDELVNHTIALEHSGVEQSLKQKDTKPLEELIDSIVADPDCAPHTTVSYVSRRMREHNVDESLALRLFEHATRMPHVAQHLARLFRHYKWWSDLNNWYVRTAERMGQKHIWSVFHWGTIFPSSEQNSVVADFFANQLANGTLPLLQVPLACERLAAWKSTDFQAICMAAAKNDAYAHWFARRALAISACQLGAPRTVVRNMLTDFDTNQLTLAFLEDQGHRGIKVINDFSGGKP